MKKSFIYSIAWRRGGRDKVICLEVWRAAVEVGANNDMGRKNGKNNLGRKE
jgi:hypothetical protein